MSLPDTQMYGKKRGRPAKGLPKTSKRTFYIVCHVTGRTYTLVDYALKLGLKKLIFCGHMRRAIAEREAIDGKWPSRITDKDPAIATAIMLTKQDQAAMRGRREYLFVLTDGRVMASAAKPTARFVCVIDLRARTFVTREGTFPIMRANSKYQSPVVDCPPDPDAITMLDFMDMDQVANFPEPTIHK